MSETKPSFKARDHMIESPVVKSELKRLARRQAVTEDILRHEIAQYPGGGDRAKQYLGRLAVADQAPIFAAGQTVRHTETLLTGVIEEWNEVENAGNVLYCDGKSAWTPAHLLDRLVAVKA